MAPVKIKIGKLSLGHQKHQSGSGPHQDKRLKRLQTRTNQLKQAIEEQMDNLTTFPTLFKRDNHGKVRQWLVYAEGDKYYVEHGLKDGAKQTTFTVVKGKSVGRANETTAEQQALAEAQSAWNKQRDRKGYSEDVNAAKPLSPMLAQSYDKQGHKIIYPAFIQVKLDGLRCLAKIDKLGNATLWSRQGKQFKVLQHIELSLKNLNLPECILDGELYNHEYHDDFQTLVSAIKRDEPIAITDKVQYHIYDLVSNNDFVLRTDWLYCEIEENDIIKLVDTYDLECKDDLRDQHEIFLKSGYEGSILRNRRGPYEIGKRSYNLQKYKDFDDDEFLIVGAEENKGLHIGQCSFICKTKTGQTFAVKPKGTEAVRRQYWLDYQQGKLEGKHITVRFFGVSNDGIPRFPVGLKIKSEYE